MKTSAILGVALCGLLGARTAQASFHLTKVVQVFGGTPAAPNAQFIELQAFAAGQNLIKGHSVTIYDASNSVIGSFTFSSNAANSADQATILLATSEAQAFFGVSADLVLTASIPAVGGKICFDGLNLDCVAWGNYAGSASGVGTPVSAKGLPPGQALRRRLDLSGGSTTLDVGDDTDNSANDFVLGAPAPKNNAGQSGTIPAQTCGNGALEGLEPCDDANQIATDACIACVPAVCGDIFIHKDVEQCDDGNTVPGDGCSSTCKFEPVCGNGIKESGEQCDDFNTVPNDGCNPTCQLDPYCGDKKVNQANEQCDDGNNMSDDGCSSTCLTEAPPSGGGGGGGPSNGGAAGAADAAGAGGAADFPEAAGAAGAPAGPIPDAAGSGGQDGVGASAGADATSGGMISGGMTNGGTTSGGTTNGGTTNGGGGKPHGGSPNGGMTGGGTTSGDEPSASDDSGGCSCRVTRGKDAYLDGAGLLTLAALLVQRRRGARRRTR